MNPIEEAKNAYLSEAPPERLGAVVSGAIARGLRRRRNRLYRAGLATAAAFCVGFVALMNSGSPLAGAIGGVPILGGVARAVTFHGGETSLADPAGGAAPPPAQAQNGAEGAAAPAPAEAAPDPAVPGGQTRAAPFAAGAQQEALVSPIWQNAQVAITGGRGGLVSFSVALGADGGAAFFYTVDSGTGELVTLEDLLGPEYRARCNREIAAQIASRRAADPETCPYYEGEQGFQGISEKQAFYLNADGAVVLRFEGGVLAPEEAGVLEFHLEA